MTDNPNLTGQDRSTVSKQPHEIQYVVTALRKEFPDIAPEHIQGAALNAKQRAGTAREAVLREARQSLSSMERVTHNEKSV
jgi:hypothetical protein